MKFIIDTERKSIVLEESSNFAIFVETMQQMLGDSWKEYTLEKTITFSRMYPYMTVQPVIYPSIPAWQPNWIGQPSIIYGSTSQGSNNVSLTTFSAK
jgi:hypothetical protein